CAGANRWSGSDASAKTRGGNPGSMLGTGEAVPGVGDRSLARWQQNGAERRDRAPPNGMGKAAGGGNSADRYQQGGRLAAPLPCGGISLGFSKRKRRRVARPSA